MLDTVVLVGIAAGGAVFVGTIIMVYFLLQQGGSFDRMRQEAVGMPAVLGEQKPLLYDELLAIAKTRALKPELLVKPLIGGLVGIRNLSTVDDSALLHDISCGKPMYGIYREVKYDSDELIWRYMEHGPFATAADFAAAQCAELPGTRHFVIIDVTSNQPIGMLSLCKHSPCDLRVEIGDVWLAPAFQGTGAVAEAVLLLMQHLFSLKYRRVEWRCDGHNVRARRAAHSMGFTFEGVLRKHRVVKDCNHDTVVFAVLNSEWPMVEEQLKAKVSGAVAQADVHTTEASAKSKKHQ